MRSCCRVTLAVLVFLGRAMAVDAGQGAPTPAAPTSDDCLACHSDPALKRSSGASLTVDATAVAASIHAPLSCVDCHQDLATAELPHTEKLAPAACQSCHDEPQSAYAKGIHARARDAGTTVAANCASCHGTHDIKPSSDPSSRTSARNLVATCAACHGNADVIRRGRIAIGDVASQYHDSIHGRARERSGLVVAPSCVDCHGSHAILPRRDPNSPVFETQVPSTCGTCHQGVADAYRGGIHAAALADGNPAAPQCATCHTAHTIQRIDSEPWKLSVTNECGTCHSQVVDSFRRTFHGKVNQLGFGSAAACADCHGAHGVQPASNPASTIAPGNLVTTCAKCHAGANARFVEYDPHPDPRNYARSPVLWWANRLYTVLIAGCFGFFALHSGLWFWRSRRERRRTTPGHSA